MPKSSKIWGMANLLEIITKSLIGKQYYEVKLKNGYTSDETLTIEKDLDTRYKPTREFFEFLKIKEFGEAYEYLKVRYEKLKKDEEKWQIDKSEGDNFPVQSVAYWYSLKIYTRATHNKLSLTNLNNNQSRKAFDELEELKNRFEADPRKKDELGLEVQVAAMKLLEKLVALKLVKENDKVSDFIGKFTTDETDYMNRRN